MAQCRKEKDRSARVDSSTLFEVLQHHATSVTLRKGNQTDHVIEQALVHALEYSFEDSMSFGDLAKELGDVANKRQLREACNRLVAAKLLERAPGPGEQYAIALR